MASFNKVVLVGNLGQDVELKYTKSGTAVTEISLAINERRKQGEEYVDDTTWVSVVLWGRQAEVCSEYCSKGDALLIEGRLTVDKWEQDGQKRSKTKVTANSMQMLGKKNNGGKKKEAPQ